METKGEPQNRNGKPKTEAHSPNYLSTSLLPILLTLLLHPILQIYRNG
jgi:hypothetical protein